MTIRMRFLFYLALLTLFTPLSVLGVVAPPDDGGKVVVATIEGAINPASADYLSGVIDNANSLATIDVIVIELDTPGGLDTSMRQIVKSIQGSSVPVIVYVSPSGSRAASAGAFITMSAHVAAMAPGASIGAATPVNMAPTGMDETMKKKVTNDAAAYIRSIAEAHGRNGEWGEKFVRKGSSLTEKEALENNVIDYVADNLDELLAKVDGVTVKTTRGEVIIKSANATVVRIEMTWRQRLFDTMANPNIAYLLLMLGFYGLIFELSNPGAILPGVVGSIALVLALYSLQALPINYAGVLLIIMALVMFMLEIWIPSFGLLTLGGLMALIGGSLMLIDSPEEYMKISLAVIIPTALFSSGFSFFLVGAGIRAQYRRVTTGKEAMIGSRGVTQTGVACDSPGQILVQGEVWNAICESQPVGENCNVEITGCDGLTLIIKEI